MTKSKRKSGRPIKCMRCRTEFDPDAIDKQIGYASCPKCETLVQLNYTVPAYRSKMTVNGKELLFDKNA